MATARGFGSSWGVKTYRAVGSSSTDLQINLLNQIPVDEYVGVDGVDRVVFGGLDDELAVCLKVMLLLVTRTNCNFLPEVSSVHDLAR